MRALAVLGAAVLLGPAVPVARASADEAYRAEIRRWREAREARLKADGGWLTVVGLFWLKPGENRFGSDPAGEVVLPPGSAPPVAGAFTLRSGVTSVKLEAGVRALLGSRPLTGPTTLRPDSSGSTDVLEMGRLSLHVIERDGRYGIRLKDRDSEARKAFTGLKWFEVDEGYRVEARWVAHPELRPLKVPNVLGRTGTMPSPGYAEFTLEGKRVRLDGVLEEPHAEEMFFILRDRTSGKETYGAGRFLYTELPKDGRVRLDFNKAYNPPCAFTPFATCPLPPPQNWLAVRIEAGEKSYGPAH